MLRGSLYGALAVAIAAVVPVVASAATAPAAAPVLATAPYVSPAILQWTPGADPLNISQTIMRAPGGCDAPTGDAVPVRVYPDNTTAQHYANPGDGVWCFSVRATDSAGATADSARRTVGIDTTPPIVTLVLRPPAAASALSGTVRLASTATDEISGVASRSYHVGAVGGCQAGGAVPASWNTTALPNGTYDVCAVATDVAGNVGIASITVTVANPLPVVPTPQPVVTPVAASAAEALPTAPPPAESSIPKSPSRLELVLPKSRGQKPVLRWSNPAGDGLDRVVVVLNRTRPPRDPRDGRIIYHGLGTTAPISLRPGQRANVAIYSYDPTGNTSRPARLVVSLAPLIPLRPLTGSVLATTPILSWKATLAAAYYNVQVFRNGRRVLVGWPRHPSYRLPAVHALKPGTYVWFVWPALRDRKHGARFATLIGRATFTIRI